MIEILNFNGYEVEVSWLWLTAFLIYMIVRIMEAVPSEDEASGRALRAVEDQP